MFGPIENYHELSPEQQRQRSAQRSAARKALMDAIQRGETTHSEAQDAISGVNALPQAFVEAWRQLLLGRRLMIQNEPAVMQSIRAERLGYQSMIDGTTPRGDLSISQVSRYLEEPRDRERAALNITRSENAIDSSEMPASFTVLLPHEAMTSDYRPDRVVVQVDRYGIIDAVVQG